VRIKKKNIREGFGGEEAADNGIEKIETSIKHASNSLKNLGIENADEIAKKLVSSEVENTLNEAEYQGKTVKLNKPSPCGKDCKKKFKVYVKNDKGNVVKVTFGDPNMQIRRDNPEAKKSFRARHKCSEKKDKTTAGYWSCKMWSNKKVSDIVSEDLRESKKGDDDPCWDTHKKVGTKMKGGKRVNDCVPKDKNESIDEGRDGSSNYMFWQNLKTIRDAVEGVLSMNESEVDAIIADGHAWAVDHISTSKDDVEEVYNFIKGKVQGDVNESVKPSMTKRELVESVIEITKSKHLSNRKVVKTLKVKDLRNE
tara:strand:+ start:24000 stop:24932 length:933 start_codon:yes stop_codon:yes gene_type:complete